MRKLKRISEENTVVIHHSDPLLNKRLIQALYGGKDWMYTKRHWQSKHQSRGYETCLTINKLHSYGPLDSEATNYNTQVAEPALSPNCLQCCFEGQVK